MTIFKELKYDFTNMIATFSNFMVQQLFVIMNDSINKKKQTSLLNHAQQNNPPSLNFDGNITEELKEILAKKKSKKGKGYNSYTYYQSKRREGDKKWQELTKKEQEEWKSKAILENKVSYIMIKI